MSSDPLRFFAEPFPLLSVREIWRLEEIISHFPSLKGAGFDERQLARVSIESASAAQRHTARFVLGVWAGTAAPSPVWFPHPIAELLEPFDFHRAWRAWSHHDRQGFRQWLTDGEGWFPPGR